MNTGGRKKGTGGLEAEIDLIKTLLAPPENITPKYIRSKKDSYTAASSGGNREQGDGHHREDDGYKLLLQW